LHCSSVLPLLSRCFLLAVAVGPPALVGPVTRAVGTAAPPNQGSSSSLLEAVAAPPAQGGPVMRGLGTARRAEPFHSSGSDSPGSEQGVFPGGTEIDGCRIIRVQSKSYHKSPLQTALNVGVNVGVASVLISKQSPMQSIWVYLKRTPPPLKSGPKTSLRIQQPSH